MTLATHDTVVVGMNLVVLADTEVGVVVVGDMNVVVLDDTGDVEAVAIDGL